MTKPCLKLRVWCFVGLALSVYATYVEVNAELDNDYEAFCDLSEKISCTKVFSSKFGKGFGISRFLLGEKSQWNPPNGILGIIFYIILFFTANSRSRLMTFLQLFLCAASNLMSVYLAYLLYFVLDNLCVVCVGIYVVNAFCLLESYRAYKQRWMVKEEQMQQLNKED